MGRWELVAQGTNVDNLEALVRDRQLPKGTRVRFEMDLSVPVAWGFDVMPNWAWPAPGGMEVIDVWGEGWNKGVVEMEADPAWLGAIIGFVKAHWLAITITGLALIAIVALIKMWQWVAKEPVIAWVLIACGAGLAAYVGYKVVRKET